MNATMNCPRRLEGWSPIPGPDTWIERNGVKCCSFCGSMHPEEFLVMSAAGAKLGPTDKNYKVYVDLPNPEWGKRIVTGSESGPAFDPVTHRPNKPDLSFWEMLINRYDRKIYGEGREFQTVKFYFMHLSMEQQHRFINLCNSGALKFGHPGFFYRMPFFIEVGRPGEGE